MKGYVILLAVLSNALARVSYDGYQAWEISVTAPHQVEFLRQLEQDGQIEIAKPVTVDGSGIVIVSPEKLRRAKIALTMSGIQANIHIGNIQEDLDRETERLQKRYEADPYSFNLNDFNTFSSLMAQMEKWAKACPRGLQCSTYSIGTTYEGRPMKVLKISKAGSNNRVIWLESCIHSREWLACATSQNIINHLVTKYGSDAEVTRMVNKFDFYFLLVANPDGYEHTFVGDRMWRKNRSPNPGARCKGTDLNRNFDDLWGKEGASNDACRDTYAGSSAASEKATQAMQNGLTNLKQTKEIAAVFAIHCFGKMWMFSYSHTLNHAGFRCMRTKDHADLVAVVAKGKAALERKEGTSGWRTGTICETIYPVTGSVVDFIYNRGVKYAFAMELRGTWFIVSPSLIQPSFREFWAGLVASTDEMAIREKWQ